MIKTVLLWPFRLLYGFVVSSVLCVVITLASALFGIVAMTVFMPMLTYGYMTDARLAQSYNDIFKRKKKNG